MYICVACRSIGVEVPSPKMCGEERAQASLRSRAIPSATASRMMRLARIPRNTKPPASFYWQKIKPFIWQFAAYRRRLALQQYLVKGFQFGPGLDCGGVMVVLRG